MFLPFKPLFLIAGSATPIINNRMEGDLSKFLFGACQGAIINNQHVGDLG